MNEKKLLTKNEIELADVISGKVLITDCVVEDFYESVSTSFLSYIKFNAEPMSLEEVLDCSMRVVLIPHHAKIEELLSKAEETKTQAEQIKDLEAENERLKSKIKEWELVDKLWAPLRDYIQTNSIGTAGFHYGDIAIERIKELEDELKEERAVVDFYADRNTSWESYRIIPQDREQFSPTELRVGGRRARERQKQRKGVSDEDLT